MTFTPLDLDEGSCVDNWEKPSKAVIVSDGSFGAVMFHAGPHIHQDIDNVGSHLCDDLGLECRPGIWIWEGAWKGGTYQYYNGEWIEPELVGTYRAPNAEEWTAIKKGKNPWNVMDWLMEETVQ